MGDHEHETALTPADRDELAHGLGEGDGGDDEHEHAGDDEHEHERQAGELEAPADAEAMSAATAELEQGAAPMSERELERRAQTLERSFQRHAAKVGELYGDEAVRLAECPLCPEQHKGFVHLDYAGLVPEDVQDAVRLYFGIARQRDYKQDPGTNTCQVCDGYGQVQTGSHVPGHENRVCPNCLGYGYMPPPPQLQGGNGMAVKDGGAAVVLEALTPPDERDPWGEPRILPDGRENPNYGRMPSHKILVEPWGATAGLGAFDTAPA